MITWCKAKYAALREHAKGWKTIIFTAIAGSPLITLQVLNELAVLDLATLIPSPWGLRIATFILVATFFLRLITTGPVGSKGDVAPTEDTKAGD